MPVFMSQHSSIILKRWLCIFLFCLLIILRLFWPSFWRSPFSQYSLNPSPPHATSLPSFSLSYFPFGRDLCVSFFSWSPWALPWVAMVIHSVRWCWVMSGCDKKKKPRQIERKNKLKQREEGLLRNEGHTVGLSTSADFLFDPSFSLNSIQLMLKIFSIQKIHFTPQT